MGINLYPIYIYNTNCGVSFWTCSREISGDRVALFLIFMVWFGGWSAKNIFKQCNQRWQIPRPTTCQCLATFTPHWNFDIFLWVISLLAQTFIVLIDRATQEVAMRYAIELLGLMSADEAWRSLTYVTFLFDLPEVCMQKFVIIHRKYHYSLAWDTLLTPKIWV